MARKGGLEDAGVIALATRAARLLPARKQLREAWGQPCGIQHFERLRDSCACKARRGGLFLITYGIWLPGSFSVAP